jgi:hypothetical protein
MQLRRPGVATSNFSAISPHFASRYKAIEIFNTHRVALIFILLERLFQSM